MSPDAPDAPDAPDPEKILKRLAEDLDVGRLLRDHPEWTREDVRRAWRPGPSGFRKARRPRRPG